MVSTPTKSEDCSFNQSLTPVRSLDSPKLKTSSSDSNVAACKTRLESILKTIQDNFDKWKLAEKRGLSLCSGIETIKTKVLEKPTDSSDYTLYPKELKLYCDKLSIIASIFHDITENARQSLKQLKALSKLPGSCNEVFYRSWQLTDYIDFLNELLERYEKEANVKKQVAENVAHCLTRADLIRCVAAWEYPQNVDFYIQLQFTILKEELCIRK